MVGNILYIITILLIIWKYLTDVEWFKERFSFQFDKVIFLEDVKLVPLLVLFQQGSYFFISYWAEKYSLSEELGRILGSVIPYSSSLLSILPSILYLSILAPIVEELGFRGFFFEWLNKKQGTYVAIIVNSMIFGILHWQNCFGAFCLGLIVSLIRVRKSNLFPSMLFHGLYNFGVIILANIVGAFIPILPLSVIEGFEGKNLIVGSVLMIMSAVPIITYFQKHFKSLALQIADSESTIELFDSEHLDSPEGEDHE